MTKLREVHESDGRIEMNRVESIKAKRKIFMVQVTILALAFSHSFSISAAEFQP